MNRRLGILVTVAASVGVLAGAAQLMAQAGSERRSRYIVKDLGTFGGPFSAVSFTPHPLNDGGTVTGLADTAVPDPFDPFCMSDCFVAHAFLWRQGALTDLGSLVEGASSVPNGINAAGVIVGISENGQIDPASAFPPVYRAVVWKHGRIIDLGTLGGSFSYASGVNDRGQVVGSAMNAVADPFVLAECGDDVLTPTERRAYIWEEGSDLQELGTLGGPDSCAMFINKHGQVTGNSFTNYAPNPATGVPTQDPFFWANGRMTDLGGLGGTLGHISAMNDRGQVCGDSDLEGDETQHGFFWDDGTMTDLTPESPFSVSEAMNDKGEVVGGAVTPDGLAFLGYVWKRGVRHDLAAAPGFECSSASSINAKDQIVGSSFPCADEGPQHAVLWERPGPATDLNTLIGSGSGLTLTSATSINDAGEITGQAVLANGDEHAYVLIPRDRRPDGIVVNATAAGDPEVAQTGQGSRAGQGGLTAQMKAMLRGRLAHRRSGLGRMPAR